MTAFIIVLSIISFIFAILSVFSGISIIKNQKSYTMPQQLRKFIRENRDVYGVCNHGKSMDDINDIRVLSPKEIGIEE